MISFSQDWNSTKVFLPPYDIEVCVLYKIGDEIRCNIGIHASDKDLVNTESLFFIDYLSPLLFRLGTPRVLYWAYLPDQDVYEI